MSGSNTNFGEKGKTFGKIIIGIALIIIAVIYVYHHAQNGIVFPD